MTNLKNYTNIESWHYVEFKMIFVWGAHTLSLRKEAECRVIPRVEEYVFLDDAELTVDEVAHHLEERKHKISVYHKDDYTSNSDSDIDRHIEDLSGYIAGLIKSGWEMYHESWTALRNAVQVKLDAMQSEEEDE